MSDPNYMLRLCIMITVIPVLMVIFATQPVTALTVTNPIIVMKIKPGMTYQFPMAVSLSPSDSASNLSVDVGGFGQSGGGSYTLLAAAQDTGSYSARTFVTVDSPLIHLAPGQRKDFNATIRVPQNVGEGGRYALIYIHKAAAPGGKVSFGAAVIVPVMLTISDTALSHTGSITNLETVTMAAGKPLQIRTTLKNTGNYHYYHTVNQVTVTSGDGRTLSSDSTTPSIYAIIPGNTVQFTLQPKVGTLPVGIYTVSSKVLLENGQVLDIRTTTFEVKTTGITTPTVTATVTATMVGVPLTPVIAGTPAPTTVLGLPMIPTIVVIIIIIAGSLLALLWGRRKQK